MGSIINARWSRLAAAIAVVAGLLSVGTVVLAHECSDDPPGNGQGQARGHQEACEDTAMAPNWRDPYVPLFTLADHEDDEQRHEAQRWRDEWGCDTQHCIWVKTNSSVDGGSPTSVHAGTAADHSMFEVAHQSEDHRTGTESNHDAHGGAVYADVCVSSDDGTSYEGQAGACESEEDTEVGVVLVDHNSCGTVVPYVSCTDEYHIVRPLDGQYTDQQTQNTLAAPEQIAGDPHRYLCGHGPGSDDCLVPATP